MKATTKLNAAMEASQIIDGWFLENLVCPRDGLGVTISDAQLTCENGHVYPVLQGVPVMLIDEVPETLGVMSATMTRTRGERVSSTSQNDYYLETLGISDEEREGVLRLAAESANGIDPVVSYLVAATNGIMYKQLIGQLQAYPIPDLPLPDGDGRLFLDIGCSWGRWCVAAARKGYSPVGLDPSLGAVMAAKRVAKQLGLPIRFVVGDARYLPFKNQAVETVFSYSVIQHFSYDDANMAIREASRVLATNGMCHIQLPNTFGLRCLYHQARRAFREPSGFEVRYWTPKKMEQTFGKFFQFDSLKADCFFGIGLQASDSHMMPLLRRLVIKASEFAKNMCTRIPVLTRIADSIWVTGIHR